MSGELSDLKIWFLEECTPGFYRVGTTSTCDPCMNNCETCSDGTSCDTCKENRSGT